MIPPGETQGGAPHRTRHPDEVWVPPDPCPICFYLTRAIPFSKAYAGSDGKQACTNGGVCFNGVNEHADDRVESGRSISTEESPNRLSAQIEKWRADLINLSRGNRLLHFRPTRVSTLEVVSPAIHDVVSRLLDSRRKTWLFHEPPEVDDAASPASPDPNELLTDKSTADDLRASLTALHRKSIQEFIDKGLWLLYLGVGILSWIEAANDQPSKSPILLIPVELQRENPRSRYELRRVDEEILLNPALVLKLEHDFGFKLPALEETDDVHPATILGNIQTTVAGRDGWLVEPRMVLATFSFHKEVIYRDLQENEDAIGAHAAVRALALGPDSHADLAFDPVPEDRLDEEAPPEQTLTVLDADASQRQCIAAARAGKSFAMDGPPGTGKSQTIANMIAELLHAGKTVLFVSEKAAALDVVYSRLEAAGLGEYVMQLHSHKATRREAAQELGRALAYHPTPSIGISDSELLLLTQRRRELNDYAIALNVKREPLGLSLHQALGRIAQLQVLPQAPLADGVGADLSADGFTAIRETAAALARVWDPVERRDDFVWRDLLSEEVGMGLRQELATRLDAALSSLDDLERITRYVGSELGLPWHVGSGDSVRLREVLGHLSTRHEIPLSWLTEASLQPIIDRISWMAESTNRHRKQVAEIERLAGPDWERLSGESLTPFEGALSSLRESPLGPVFSDRMSVEELRALRGFFENSPERLLSFREQATALAKSVGVLDEEFSLVRCQEIAQLGSYAGVSSSPESAWLDSRTLDAAREAHDTLAPLVSEFRERHQVLKDTFLPTVLRLDLDSLSERFKTVHRGLGKLRSEYREDKALLLPHTTRKKVSKATIRELPAACEWRDVYLRLKAAEERHARVLGSHYYRSLKTDLETLASALSVAERVVVLLGPKYSLALAQRQFGRDGTREPSIRDQAASLSRELESWIEEATKVLGNNLKAIDSLGMDSVAALCGRLTSNLASIIPIIEGANKIRGRPLNVGTTRACLTLRKEVERIRLLFDSEDLEACVLLGGEYAGLQTDWVDIRRRFEWVVGLRELLGGSVDPHSAERLQSVTLSPETIEVSHKRWNAQLDQLISHFRPAYAKTLRADIDAAFDDGRRLLNHLQTTRGDIDTWRAFREARDNLAKFGLAAAVAFCEERSISRNDVPGALERSVLETWTEEIVRSESSRLKSIRADDRDHYVREFRELDKKFVSLAAGRVMGACNDRRPRTTVGAASIVLREAQKKKRHMPIRDLFAQATPVVLSLKPCFMMSPLTVSQFLPPMMHFDAVIMDEASQVKPSDAVNCIYRGRQFIVAGDQKQLPPTTFFEKVGLDESDEYVEDQLDEFESILDLCKSTGGFPSLPLRWHYRSQHESLITFSNYMFYDGKLVTFPGSLQQGPDIGIEFFHANGIYRRGGARDNPLEAELVVDRVFYHAQNHPSLTLGVVAFSEPQASAIEAAIERRRQEHPEFDAHFVDDRLRGFFVKNIENVQGDERDIIIFSVGYGRDEAGKFTMNFGPLNQAGGPRRLNVAITRAKRRVEIIASVSSSDFAPEIKSEGGRLLRKYIEYAERGIGALSVDTGASGMAAESAFEEEVARVIRSWGYQVEHQVGTAGYRIDLGIRDASKPGAYLLGIECDGAAYHSSHVARDRDRLRGEVLGRLGWRLYRIWGPSWYRDRQGQESRLRKAIEDTMTGRAHERRAELASRSEASVEMTAISLDAPPSWALPYRVAHVGSPSTFWPMHDPAAQPELRRLILEIVRVEAPVASEIALQRIREAWGAGRAGQRIRTAFLSAVESLRRKGDLGRDRRSFLWGVTQNEPEVRIPVSSDPASNRSVDHVPPEEIRLAMRNIVKDAMSVSKDDLQTAVARLFGWNRRGVDISRALEDSLHHLQQMGLVRVDGEMVKLQDLGPGGGNQSRGS